MPPQYSPQPAPPPLTPQSGGSDPYHFIMNPEPPKKSSRLLPNTSGAKGRILVVLGGLFVLMIIAWIVMSLLGSSGQEGTQSLASVAAHQQEIIRISQLGVTSAKSQDTKNLALTTQLSVSSDQQQLLARLTASKVKVSKTQLDSRHSNQTDALFTQATQTNQFDETFNKTLQEELLSYERSIQTAYKANTGPVVRGILTKEMNTASTLAGPPKDQSK